MEIRHLLTFKKIVELQSFTKAADDLGYSQPTVTSHIQAMEEDLGIKLFDRIGRKIILTHAGNQLIQYVNQIADIYDQMEGMAEDQGGIRGRIKIGAPETLTIYRLGPILREYRQSYPAVDIILCNDFNAPLYEKLKNGEIDIAFQIGADDQNQEYIVIDLAYESLVLVANNDCGIDDLEPSPEQLANESVIYNAKGCIYRTVFEEYLKSRQIVPRNTIELWSIEGIKQAVVNGLGISVLPFITVKDDLEGGRLKALDVKLHANKIPLRLVYHKNKWLSKSILAWIDLAQRHAGNW